jgi:uncharacterized protein (DUF305 family)
MSPIRACLTATSLALAAVPVQAQTPLVADRDFVAGMISTHQRAIDLARMELQDGKDPDLRRRAEAIIAGQTHDLAALIAWQERHAPVKE